MLNSSNAIAQLGEIMHRVGEHRFPVQLTPTTRQFIDALSAELDEQFHPDDPDALLKAISPLERIVGASLQNIASPTLISAGNKTNVIPSLASAELDCRFLPGHEDEFIASFVALVGPNATCEIFYRDIAVETDFPTPLTHAMATSVARHDPGAGVIPYLLPAVRTRSTSAGSASPATASPLKLPADFDFPAAFHGVDERVPVDALRFGVPVLDDFFDRC